MNKKSKAFLKYFFEDINNLRNFNLTGISSLKSLILEYE